MRGAFGRWCRTGWALGGGVGSALIGTWVSALLLATPAAALPAECVETGVNAITCTYTTAGDNSFTVPAGVTSVHLAATGGSGAAAGAVGGFGAVASGDLAVTPGQTLHAVVGGNGSG